MTADDAIEKAFFDNHRPGQRGIAVRLHPQTGQKTLGELEMGAVTAPHGTSVVNATTNPCRGQNARTHPT